MQRNQAELAEKDNRALRQLDDFKEQILVAAVRTQSRVWQRPQPYHSFIERDKRVDGTAVQETDRTQTRRDQA